jgi:hypothetical protein
MGAFLWVSYFFQFAKGFITAFTLTQHPIVPPSFLCPAAHNARFDFQFLNAEFARAGWKGGLHTGLCTLALSKKVLSMATGQEGGSYRLGDLVQVRRNIFGCWLHKFRNLFCARPFCSSFFVVVERSNARPHSAILFKREKYT